MKLSLCRDPKFQVYAGFFCESIHKLKAYAEMNNCYIYMVHVYYIPIITYNLGLESYFT